MNRINVVAEKRVNVTIYNKDGYLYLNFVLHGIRKQKALKMKDTAKNRKIVQNEIIPKLQVKILTGEYEKNESKRTFGYYADFFLEDKEKKTRGFKAKFPIYYKIIVLFKNKFVDEITRFDVKRYLNELDIKPTSKKIYLSTIREVLDLAVDDGILRDNVTVGIKLGKDDSHKSIRYFKKNEVKTLLDNAKEPLKMYLKIAFNTGMRPEEILGLKKSDINNGFVSIQRVKRLGEILNATKTVGSKRTIPFHIDISHIKTNEEGYLFPSIDDVQYFRKSWKSLLLKCNIEHRGIYHTRHTFATHLLRENIISISELSGLLGHVKVSTTLSFYASVIDSFNNEVSTKISRFSYA